MSMRYKSITVSDEEFAALFPDHTDQELADLWHTSRAAVYSKAQRLGLRKSPEHIARTYKASGEARRGEGAYNWKGGITARLRQGDPRYAPWRDAVRERDRYTCTQCGDRRRRCEMHAHHIMAYADYLDLRYELSNGTTLCKPCHDALHGTQPRPRIQIPCKCGCGTLLDAVDKWGYDREWVKGHQGRGKTITPEQRAAIAKGGEKRRGVKRSPEVCAHLSAVKTGHTLTDAERAGNQAGALKRRGRVETAETRAKKSASHTGKPLSDAHRAAISAGHRRRRDSATE